MNHPYVVRRISGPKPLRILAATETAPHRWVGLHGEVMRTFAGLGVVDDGYRATRERRYGAA